MTTPADELRAAAEELRDYASTASPAPWAVNQWGNVETSGHEEMAEVWPLQANPGANATYIALMGPDVGHALADLLDAIGTHLAANTHPDWQEAVAPLPLAVARALNGDAR